MTTKRGKHSQPLCPSLVMKKWLSIQPKVYEYSEEEVDTETESEDDACSLNDARMHTCGTLGSRTPWNQPVSSQISGKHCICCRLVLLGLRFYAWIFGILFITARSLCL